MIQTIVWDQHVTENMIQRSALDRIEFIESLTSPTLGEMSQIIAKRLSPVFNLAVKQPEYLTYPFPESYIQSLGESVGWNPRSVLKQLSIEFTKMKSTNSITLLETVPVIVPKELETKQSDLPEFLSNQIKRIVTNYKEIVKDESLTTKEAYLENGFFDLFGGMKDSVTVINAKTVTDIAFKKKVNEIDIILTTKDATGTPEKWGIEICNNERGQSFTNMLKMLQRYLTDSTISRWIVIEILNQITGQGRVFELDPADDITI